MKRVAVVILNWNGEALLKRYLPTVVKTSVNECVDVVVADNASTDGSIGYIKTAFPDVKIVRLDKNYGFTGGYNRAITHLNYEYIILLNSDVATTPHWIEPLVELMDSDATIAACTPKIIDDKRHTHFEYAGAAGGYIDWLGYPFCRGRILDNVEEDKGQYNDYADCLWGSGAALMIRRQLYVDCGGLDEDFFAHMEEIDLCWRLCNRGLRIVACGQSAVFHLGGATLNSSNPRKTFLNFRNNLTMMVKNYNSHLWPLVIFLRLLLDGVAGAKFILDMKPAFCWAIVKAHWNFFYILPQVIKKRNLLRAYRGNRLPETIKKYSLLFRYYLKGMKTYDAIDIYKNV